MKLRISLLTTASFVTLVIVVLSFLRPTGQQVSGAQPTPDPIATVNALSEKLTTPEKPKSDVITSIESKLDRSVHPGEPSHNTLNQRFSIANSLSRIQQIDKALLSFRKLTGKSQTVLNQQAVSEVGNTDPETQTLGFRNWTGAVTGTLKQQDYQIKKLEFELAQKQYKDGEISKATLDRKQADYKKAAEEFKKFINSSRIAD